MQSWIESQIFTLKSKLPFLNVYARAEIEEQIKWFEELSQQEASHLRSADLDRSQAFVPHRRSAPSVLRR